MRCNFIAWAAVALIAATPFATARADVLFDNVTGIAPNGAPDGIANYSGSSEPVGPLAVSFSTGSSAVYLPYTSFTFDLEATTPDDGGSVTATLFASAGAGVGKTSNNAIHPGTSVASLGIINDSQLSSAAYSLISVTSSQAVLLSANTTYWVELSSTASNSSPSSAAWANEAATGGGVGVDGEYAWNNYAGVARSWLITSRGGYMMQVAVPEPSSILVIGVGLIGLVATRRKRSRGSIFGASSA